MYIKYKVLVSNFLALSTLQVLNVVLPFITLPYLTIVIGLENLGKLNIAYALAVFSQIIIEYGFNTTTTRDIALLDEKKGERDFIINQVVYSKILLFLCCCLLQIVFFFLIKDYNTNVLIYLLQFGVIVFQAMFPIWFFQGIQKMKFVTFLNVIFKVLFTVCIFIFVKNEHDYWKAPLFTCIGYFLSCLSAFIIIYFKFKVRFYKISFQAIKKQLKNGAFIFSTDFMTGMIPNLNLLILGSLKGEYAAGIYSIADKLIRAFSNLQLPIINTLFPYLSKFNNTQNKEKTIQNLLKFGVIFLIIALVSMYVVTDYIYLIIFNDLIEDSMMVFQILLLFPVFYFCNQVIGKLSIIASGEMLSYFKNIFVVGIINIVLCILLTYLFGFIGTAVSVVLVEMFLTLGLFYTNHKLAKNAHS